MSDSAELPPQPGSIGGVNPSQGLIPRRLRRYAFIIDA